jgi:hypothetical protein
MAAEARTNQQDIATKARGKPGQPTKFTPELWEEIIDRIACYENIIDICDDERMPCYMTVRAWYRKDPVLKAQIEEAWQDASYLGHYVNDNILRQGSRSTGDFRRDEAIVANNRWFMGKTSKRLFGDKTTVDLNSTINISIPSWADATPQATMIEGEVIDPDLLHERQTVARLTGSEMPVEGPEKPASDPQQS